jgi:hypothetical protein
VESSFGAFARNGQGWGPGEISSAGGAPNSELRPARPGETVTLAGTGLGIHQPRSLPLVLVAGRPAKAVRAAAASAARPGVDLITFDLPADTPEGCHVPVLVSSAPGVYSNAATLAVSRSGSTCFDPEAGIGLQTSKLGTVGLVHADVEFGLTLKEIVHYPLDAGFAAFSRIEPGASANRLFLFPPMGTCTTYSGMAGLHSITSPLAVLGALPGTHLDAGLAVTVRGPGGERLLRRGGSYGKDYWAVIGGHAPVPGAEEMPLFLTPGDYEVSASGGADVGAFHVSVRAPSPLIWRNRKQLDEVNRARGATVTWRFSRWDKPAAMLILAMNSDSRSGALGVCVCLANAAAGSFHVPAYALSNIPPSPAHPRGFPLNWMILAELPGIASPAAGAGVDRLLAFATSVSARTVVFK